MVEIEGCKRIRRHVPVCVDPQEPNVIGWGLLQGSPVPYVECTFHPDFPDLEVNVTGNNVNHPDAPDGPPIAEVRVRCPLPSSSCSYRAPH